MPKTEDERRTELLRLMVVPRHPGIYVLGCFAKYVTVYAQQVRALNLIDSLAKAGILSRYTRMAIVGGGIAGLTAAAAAAIKGVESISVFEKRGNTMRLQRGTEKRFLHPYIYDWPLNAELGDEAKIPLMSWIANRAGEVIDQLDERWNEVRALVGDRLHEPHCNAEVIEVIIGESGPSITIKGEQPRNFDVVILAIGYGRDEHTGTEGYWTDTSLDGLEKEDKSTQTWFVSGYGDGALTDLMRLCIMDFRHGKVIGSVDETIRERIGKELLEAERSSSSSEHLAEVYKNTASTIANKLNDKLKHSPLGKIWLNCSEKELFSPKSSILNRLIIAYLYNAGRFDLVEGKILTPQKTEVGYNIPFEESGREPMLVDNLIIRHGPDKPLKTFFYNIWKACSQVRAEWEAARQYEDWTREPLYTEDDFSLKKKKVPPLRVDFGDRVGCVVITGSHKPVGLNQVQRIEQVLEILLRRTGSKAIAGLSIDPAPVSLSVDYALSSSAAYEWTIRALCQSDIAIFDITKHESAVMLFLGVRAATRRGITIMISQHNIATQPLPFNLASLNPVSLEGGAVQIADSIESGLAALKTQPNAYLDLPVFDAIRHLGEDYRTLEPEEQILVLRWFDTQYSKLIQQFLNPWLQIKFGEDSSIVTSLDSQSPQLVEQRLYAAIRRTKLCIADWTGWRPNVFFEIGVRLAVSRNDPIFILCAERPPGWNDEETRWPESHDPSAKALESFFAPTRFTFEEFGDLKDTIKKFDIDMPKRFPGAKIQPGRTYQVVSQSIRRRDEPGGRSVNDFLANEAKTMAGPAVPEEGGIPVLFAEVLADQVRRSAIEYLLAAWYYLDGRYNLVERFKAGQLSPTDPNLLTFQQVGQDLKDRLRNAPGTEYEEIAAKVTAHWNLIKPEEEIENV